MTSTDKQWELEMQNLAANMLELERLREKVKKLEASGNCMAGWMDCLEAQIGAGGVNRILRDWKEAKR